VHIITCVTWLIHMWYDLFTCDVTQSRREDRADMILPPVPIIICVTWLIHVWHDLFTCDVTQSRKEDCAGTTLPPVPIIICVTWLIHMWNDSFTLKMTRVKWIVDVEETVGTLPLLPLPTVKCVTWFMQICYSSLTCDMTHTYIWQDLMDSGFSWTVVFHYLVWRDSSKSDTPYGKCDVTRRNVLRLMRSVFQISSVTWLIEILYALWKVWRDSSKCDTPHAKCFSNI